MMPPKCRAVVARGLITPTNRSSQRHSKCLLRAAQRPCRSPDPAVSPGLHPNDRPQVAHCEECGDTVGKDIGVLFGEKCDRQVISMEVQSDSAFDATNAQQGPASHIAHLLPLALRRLAPEHERVVVTLHSGLWELSRLSACMPLPTLGRAADDTDFEPWRDVLRPHGKWSTQLFHGLLQPVWRAIADAANATRGRVRVLWHGLPLVCMHETRLPTISPTKLGNLSVWLNAAAIALMCSDSVRVPWH